MPKYSELCRQFQANPFYRRLPAQAGQQVIRQACQSWKGATRAAIDYWKHPEKYQAPPGIPDYERGDRHHNVIFTNQEVRHVKDERGHYWLFFPDKANLPPLRTRIKKNVQQVRMVPYYDQVKCEVVYQSYKPVEKPVVTQLPCTLRPLRILSIDTGLDNESIRAKEAKNKIRT